MLLKPTIKTGAESKNICYSFKNAPQCRFVRNAECLLFDTFMEIKNKKFMRCADCINSEVAE